MVNFTPNITLSKRIFSELMNGKIINKHVVNNASEFSINPLFSEIMDNLPAYKNQYEMNGSDFIVKPDFVYINDSDVLSEKKSPQAMKVIILLVIIGHYLNKHKYSPTKLTCAKTGGLVEEDFTAIESMTYVEEILEKANITKKGDTSFQDKVINILVYRGVMVERPTSKAYILTDAGKAFYEDVMQGFDVSTLEESDAVDPDPSIDSH